jgi:hypothetical protein
MSEALISKFDFLEYCMCNDVVFSNSNTEYL